MNNLKSLYLNQRFFPNISSVVINPFYFTRKRLLKCLSNFASSLSGRLLDFGCGSNHISHYLQKCPSMSV